MLVRKQELLLDCEAMQKLSVMSKRDGESAHRSQTRTGHRSGGRSSIPATLACSSCAPASKRLRQRSAWWREIKRLRFDPNTGHVRTISSATASVSPRARPYPASFHRTLFCIICGTIKTKALGRCIPCWQMGIGIIPSRETSIIAAWRFGIFRHRPRIFWVARLSAG
jgi:hypothetical protein